MALLLAVLQAAALVVLQHAMLAAEVALAEGAVAHDPLRPVLAVLEGALYLLGRHAAADGQRHVQGRGRGRRSEIGVAEVSDGASVEVRCLPAWTRRMSDVGADVRSESSWRRVGIVVSEGTFSGIAFIVTLALAHCATSKAWVTYCLRIAA